MSRDATTEIKEHEMLQQFKFNFKNKSLSFLEAIALYWWVMVKA